MSNFEQWAIHHVKKLVDYLDDSDIKQLVLSAIRLETPEAVIAHFSSLLGQDAAALSFISSFNERKFPAAAQARASVPASAKHTQRQTKSYAKPSGKSSMLTSDLAQPARPKLKEPVEQTTKAPKAKVKKVDALTEIEGALRELELSEQEAQTQAAITCDCQARRHPLNEVAPNCLQCGKIICSVESFTRCSFCKQPLMSRGQTQDLIAELRREKGVASSAMKQQPRKAKAGSMQKMQWSSKLGANLANMDDEELRLKSEAAEARKDALLEHVATGAKRTVIDQAADFSSTATDRWASTEERALALRKQIAALKAEEEAKGARVMTLNLGGGKASISTSARAKRKPEEVDAGIVAAQRAIDEGKAREAATQQALNKSLGRGDLNQVKVIHFEDLRVADKQNWAIKGRPVYESGWRRVQDDDDDRERLAEALILNGPC